MKLFFAQNEEFEVIPGIPIGDWIATALEWLDDKLVALWEFLELVFDQSYESLNEFLHLVPPLALIAVLVAIAWLARGWKIAVTSLIGFVLIRSMGMWDSSMETLALILIATAICIVVGVPIGILAAQNDRVSTAVRPVLDFMQTLHPFVYLPIVIAFFGIGAPPGLAATVIFAMPPAVRLTELGIRQVNAEMVEAGEAFGASRSQILGKIQLPLSMPTVMAGVNQVIMLSLSMVVLAGLVGTPGLGEDIVLALGRVNVAGAVEAGIALAIIAIFLDRTTAAVGMRSKGKTAAAAA